MTGHSEKIIRYLKGELSNEEGEKLVSEVRKDPNLNREFEELTNIFRKTEAISNLSFSPPPMASSVMARISDRKRNWFLRFFELLAIPRPSIAALAMLCVIVVSARLAERSSLEMAPTAMKRVRVDELKERQAKRMGAAREETEVAAVPAPQKADSAPSVKELEKFAGKEAKPGASAGAPQAAGAPAPVMQRSLSESSPSVSESLKMKEGAARSDEDFEKDSESGYLDSKLADSEENLVTVVPDERLKKAVKDTTQLKGEDVLRMNDKWEARPGAAKAESPKEADKLATTKIENKPMRPSSIESAQLDSGQMRQVNTREPLGIVVMLIMGGAGVLTFVYGAIARDRWYRRFGIYSVLLGILILILIEFLTFSF